MVYFWGIIINFIIINYTFMCDKDSEKTIKGAMNMRKETELFLQEMKQLSQVIESPVLKELIEQNNNEMEQQVLYIKELQNK